VNEKQLDKIKAYAFRVGMLPLSDMKRLLDALEEAEALAERRKAERVAALSVTTKEGLLASEWVLRTGLAEQERDRLLGEVERLRGELEAARVPLCVGSTTIGRLAETGAVRFEDGRGLVAADDLFQNDPYLGLRSAVSRAEAAELALFEERGRFRETLAEVLKRGAAIVRGAAARDHGEQ
jgi:hypothetical protein